MSRPSPGKCRKIPLNKWLVRLLIQWYRENNSVLSKKQTFILKLTYNEHASVFFCWANRAKKSFWFQWDNNSFFLTTIRSKDRPNKIRQFSRKTLYFWMLFQWRTPSSDAPARSKKKAKQNKMANCSLIITRIITPQPLKSHDPEPMGPYESTSILDSIFLHLVVETNPR